MDCRRKIRLCKGFGDILGSGDLEKISVAANALIDALDEVKNELESMDVPNRMREPYGVFIQSMEFYRQSAEYILSANGILLGYYDGSEDEVDELLNKSERHLIMANKYFGLSLVMHGEMFRLDKGASDESEEYAGNR
ncbi:hypothetical protein MYX76_07245 [Desulfobacterota bacterium AH_259_B03_O07]|nr:hypothetical protein [Desulfobacterota bacterium AH_259_B03_O07]